MVVGSGLGLSLWFYCLLQVLLMLSLLALGRVGGGECLRVLGSWCPSSSAWCVFWGGWGVFTGLGVLVSFQCSMVCVLGSVFFLGSLLSRLVLLWLFFRVLFLVGVGLWCLAVDACLFFVREFHLVSLHSYTSYWCWRSDGYSLFGVFIDFPPLLGALAVEAFMTILHLMLSCTSVCAAVAVCLFRSCGLRADLLGTASALPCRCCCCCRCSFDLFAPLWGLGLVVALLACVTAALELFWTFLPLLGPRLLCLMDVLDAHVVWLWLFCYLLLSAASSFLPPSLWGCCCSLLLCSG
ncbi:hypothetical protein LXL04_000805 [Taraxacum kok-saghyz]